MLKNDFEIRNFAIFEEILHNFVRSDNDMINTEKNADFQYMHTWFDAQLDQKNLGQSLFHVQTEH